MTPSAYMRAHAAGPLRINPSAYGRTRQVRRGRRIRRVVKRPRARATALHTVRLGRALELRYIHADGGRRYKHDFGRGVTVSYTKDRRYLIVGPVEVRDFIEG